MRTVGTVGTAAMEQSRLTFVWLAQGCSKKQEKVKKKCFVDAILYKYKQTNANTVVQIQMTNTKFDAGGD